MSVRRTRTSDFHEVEARIRLTWPQLQWHEVEWITRGWDFDIAVLDRAVTVRIPKVAGQRRRLKREIAWLDALKNLHLPAPDYTWRSPTMAAYPYIVGSALNVGSATPTIIEEITAYLQQLHDVDLTHPEMVRNRWQKRHRAFYIAVSTTVLPLFSLREARRLQNRFDEMQRCLAEDAWRVGLIHGDLRPEHILIEKGHVAGIIDWGDMRYGDVALDYAGIPNLLLPDPLDTSLKYRRDFYAWAASIRECLHAIDCGDVERSEQSIRVIRREL